MKEVAQKAGEEEVEVALTAVTESDVDFLGETDDLLYHLLVLMQMKGQSFAKLGEVLRARMKVKKVDLPDLTIKLSWL
nr:phosphoribosyl-ATP diphosphatase [Pajaroellobacter abortibovis]